MSPSLLLFDDFELRPDSGELFKEGTPVKLQPQPARVLAILASRPGEVVEREEIRQLVWGDSFLDFDANLNFCIKQIRQALGDSATAPRFIETLPRRGYRFLMPVNEEAPPAAAPPPPRPETRKTVLIPLLSVLLLAVILLLGIRPGDTSLPGSQTMREEATPSSPEANEAYLRGRYLLDQDPVEAAASLQKAVLLDPTFAPAYAALARALDGVEKPLCPDTPAIDAAARRAIALDPDLAEAHLALAHSLFHCHLDWEEAGREFQKALALDPGEAETYYLQAFYLSSLGLHDRAIDSARKARELDPDSMVLGSDFVYILYLGRRYDEAIQQAWKALDLISISRESPAQMKVYRDWTLWVLFHSALKIGDKATAVKAARDIVESSEEGQKAPVIRTPEDFLRWHESWLRRMKATRIDRIAMTYVGLGRYDEALDAMEANCRTRRSFMLLFTAAEPTFDPLRGDPRFERILDCIKLPAGAPARASRSDR